MHQVIVPTDDHRRYIQQRIDRCKSPEEAAKYRKQQELLEDAVVIYKLNHIQGEYHS